MKRKYEKPLTAEHRIEPMTLIASTTAIPLDIVQEEDDDISMPGGDLPPGDALSRTFPWLTW